MSKICPPEIISVKNLVTTKIEIPGYQRPYKWRLKNVDDLLNDIIFFSSKKPSYRLGTVIIDRSNDIDEIVDGQQRLLTLVLISKALEEKSMLEESDKFEIPLLKEDFTHSISRMNLLRNYQHILTRIGDFKPEVIKFFLYQCELVKVSIGSIREAFQFFDSQNSRGKALYPHNLLKAFHLREMEDASDDEKINAVQNWDATESLKLKNLFGSYLYKVRKWSKGKAAMDLTNVELDIFKGIKLSQAEQFPYARSFEMNNTFLNNYDKFSEDSNPPAYPQQLDGVIINGKRFFEFTNQTLANIEFITNYDSEFWNAIYSNQTSDILKFLRGNGGQNRKGDQYCKLLFENTILYYYSKFHNHQLEKILPIIFLWSFRERLNLKAVRYETINNHANHYNSLFHTIKEALDPSELLLYQLKPVKFNFENVYGLDVIFEKYNKLKS
mgnify:CR=1 FL=1